MHSCLVDRHVAAGTVREDFQRLVNEGVATVGLETMKDIKSRIREGIVQQDIEDLGRDGTIESQAQGFTVSVRHGPRHGQKGSFVRAREKKQKLTYCIHPAKTRNDAYDFLKMSSLH